MTLISADVQRITLNASCMTILGGRTEQLVKFCCVTGFTSDFLSFIVVEHIFSSFTEPFNCFNAVLQYNSCLAFLQCVKEHDCPNLAHNNMMKHEADAREGHILLRTFCWSYSCLKEDKLTFVLCPDICPNFWRFIIYPVYTP